MADTSHCLGWKKDAFKRDFSIGIPSMTCQTRIKKCAIAPMPKWTRYLKIIGWFLVIRGEESNGNDAFTHLIVGKIVAVVDIFVPLFLVMHILLDLDHVKHWMTGDPAGEALLKQTALNLRLRGSNLLARSGGDECSVYFSGMRQYDLLTARAEQISKASITRYVLPNGTTPTLSTSIGICPVHGNSSRPFIWKPIRHSLLQKSMDATIYRSRFEQNVLTIFESRTNPDQP